MKLCALAVLILALLPQGSDSTPQQVKQEADKNKGRNSPSSAVIKAPSPAKTSAADSPNETRTDKDEPIRVAQPIAITTRPDYATWAFSVLLVGVGAFQAYLLFKTMRAIQIQAAYMERQAGIMEGLLTEAKESRDIQTKTLILQYRPKVIVRNATAKAFTAQLGERAQCIVAFQIVNTGGSPAHIVDGDIYLFSARSSNPKEEIEFRESTHIGISERTLQPGERESIQTGLDGNFVNDVGWVEFHAGQAALHYILLMGTIGYRDDLGIPRQTGLRRSYDPKTKTFTPRKDSEEEYSD
jgi:hypothetical protein